MNGYSRTRGLFQDITHAGRALRRAPGFSLFTAAVIGLGVGAATTVFSVLSPLLIAPLPFQEPEALVWIAFQEPAQGASLSAQTSRAGNLRDFRERSRSFEGLTGFNAFSEQTAYTLTGQDDPERLVGFEVVGDFVQVLGIQPAYGRGFSQEEGAEGGPPAVVLSNGFWRRRFAADPSIVGQAITLNQVPRSVVGVLPPTFDFASIFTPGLDVDFLLPYPISDRTDRHGNEIVILGRMKDGISPQAAQADLDAVLAGLQEEQPDRWGLSAHLAPLQAHLAGPLRPALLLLAAAASTLLLIVCVNVSNLLLARSPRRAREVAVRKALGASRGRIARQLVLESLGISLLGAAVGGGLAWAATRYVAGTAGIRVPLLDQMSMNGGALLFGIGVALVTGLLVSAVPALQVADGGESTVLRESGRGSSGSRGARRMREGLVVAEVTLACVLLVVGGLLVRSFREVMDVDLGFDPANTVAWQLNPSPDFENLQEASYFFASLTDRIGQIPGVESVGLIDALPLGRNRTWTLRLTEVREEGVDPVYFFPHIIDDGYLAAMDIPTVAGRSFSRDDQTDTRRVVLLNEEGARRVFPDQDAVGRMVWLGGSEPWEVVGVVKDVRHISPELAPGIQVYLPMTQSASYRTMDMAVRSRLSVTEVTQAVAAALGEVDPSMPAREFWTLESTVDRAISARRFLLGILATYGAVALVLAGLGIYGVLSQSVAERKPEIGIRIALGASASNVVWGVMGRTLLLTGAGILAGAVLSVWATRLIGSLLFGVSASDPLTFIGMALILLAVAASAGFLPSARAARTPGTQTLRAE